MKAPDMIWLHPITEDDFQDQWWESGDDGDVPYVPEAALTEAQATIARLEAALREIDARGPNTGNMYLIAFELASIARAALSQGKGEGV